MYHVAALREAEFPITQEHLYFNNAGIAPLPQRSQQKMAWALQGLSHHPTHFWQQQGMPMAAAFQEELAAHIHAANPQEIVATSSTSAAINAVAQAVPWQQGDNIAFCEVEFPSNAYPWLSLERDGVAVRQVKAVDGGLTLAELEKVVDSNTRLVAASSVQFFSGHRTDLAAIGQFCHERGILFAVDAIQSIGHIPIDVQAMHIDILASGGQKSIMATPGSGFFYVRNEVAEMMRPRMIGANATHDFLHWLAYDLTPAQSAQRFQMGTPNLPGMFGLLESLRLIRELGVEHIDQHTTGLTVTAVAALTELGYEVITPLSDNGPITTFKSGMNQADTDALVNYLSEQHISVVKHLDAAGNPHIRLSFHCFNTAEEIAQFAAVMRAWRV
ncbi:MAG: aminotransferase class V-fold PLP-dependent enzyme [Ardenticatenaceae bacterium]|nr:aminotransferase class V-fold PLP-dependent enzyme [Ardenticatenaceae bacterium]